VVRVIEYGPRALLIEAEDPLGVFRALGALRLDGVVDVVPAASTVLVTFADSGARDRARPAVAAASPASTTVASSEVVTIPVTYDGDDLDDVSRLSGLSVEEVVARHTRVVYDVGFVGFAPGFAYLSGLDPVLHLPRLDSPRTAVPTGAVAIAGPYAAVYPTPSPGGWRLMGRTTVTVFDGRRYPPALLRPGMRVRFEVAS